MLKRDKDNMFAPGRFVMTCCVDDIQFCGIPCRYDQAKTLESRSWVMVTAKISTSCGAMVSIMISDTLTVMMLCRICSRSLDKL